MASSGAMSWNITSTGANHVAIASGSSSAKAMSTARSTLMAIAMPCSALISAAMFPLSMLKKPMPITANTATNTTTEMPSEMRPTATSGPKRSLNPANSSVNSQAPLVSQLRLAAAKPATNTGQSAEVASGPTNGIMPPTMMITNHTSAMPIHTPGAARNSVKADAIQFQPPPADTPRPWATKLPVTTVRSSATCARGAA
jgi:hypothetical protein